MDESLVEFLMDEEVNEEHDSFTEVAPDERRVCILCGCSSSDVDPASKDGSRMPFPRPGKDLYCHCVHLTGYGEMLWAAARCHVECLCVFPVTEV